MSSFPLDRVRIARALLFLAWVLLLGPDALAKHVPDEVLVRFKPGVSERAALRAIDELRAREFDAIPEMRVKVLKLPPGLSVERALSRLRKHPKVDAAESNLLFEAATLPNDPSFVLGCQWALDKIKARQAWSDNLAGADGSDSVVIAVLDTGILSTHEDLKRKLVPGYNAINPGQSTEDDASDTHGTMVAGIAAAETNNTIYIAGTAREARLMPIKVLEGDGSGELTWIIKGILWAARQPGVRVLNMSLANTEEPKDESVFGAEATETAHTSGAVLVAAAGNNANSMTTYPAAFPYVVGVSATDQNDQLASFSSFGTFVDVAAPGNWILATSIPDLVTSATTYAAGTSMSAPFVSGLAAVLFGQDPSRTNDEVISLIERSAEQPDGTGGWNPRFGHGRINMYRALAGTTRAAPAQDDLAYTYPNPFSPNLDRFTTFVVKASAGDSIEIVIFDALGNRLWETSLTAPDDLYYNSPLRWDGKDTRGRQMANGVYFARVKVGQSQVLKKIAVIR